MEERIGSCSICGGDVYGWVGAWASTESLPAPRCRNCGAIKATEVIHMVKPPTKEE